MKLLVIYYNAHDLFLHPRIAGELRMPLKEKKKKKWSRNVSRLLSNIIKNKFNLNSQIQSATN